jgi:hypothetical protein
VALGTVAFVRDAQLNNQKLELKSIEIQDTASDLKLLKQKYEILNTELDKAKGNAERVKQLEEEKKTLEEERSKLQAELQAKRESKNRAVAKSSGNVAYAAPAGSCGEWLAQAGISDPDAVWLITKESGCRPNAVNPSSGACGIPQALPCSKLPCTLQDPVCQLRWMSQYVANRYGSWSAARAWHQSHNWY